MATNFRITTTYIFEVYNPDSNNGQGGFHQVWISGQEGSLQISTAQNPDLGGVEMELPDNIIPSPPNGANSNYRLDNDGNFQLYNVDNGLWYNVWIKGELDAPPQFYIYQEGAE